MFLKFYYHIHDSENMHMWQFNQIRVQQADISGNITGNIEPTSTYYHHP